MNWVNVFVGLKSLRSQNLVLRCCRELSTEVIYDYYCIKLRKYLFLDACFFVSPCICNVFCIRLKSAIATRTANNRETKGNSINRLESTVGAKNLTCERGEWRKGKILKKISCSTVIHAR